MSFDDDVDALKRTLEAERSGVARRERAAALTALRDTLEANIASRRLAFRVETDEAVEDEPSILILHTASDEELGAVFMDDEGYSFESEDDDYFPDIAAVEDVAAFTAKLTDTLRAGLPLFELDVENAGAV